jgi:signal transduction histidine kinase
MGLLFRFAHQVDVELELRRQALVLNGQLARRNADRRQQELLAAMIVHDMRSPLTAIALSAAAGSMQPLLAQECLQEVSSAVEWAQRLVANVLDLCIARTGELTPRRSTVILRALVDRAVAAVARSAADRRVELRVHVPGANAACALDPDIIARAIINLLENAVRFSPPQTAVTLAVGVDAVGATFTVEDQGPGIPPEAREHVFEPLVSLESGTQRRGLGLAFCKTAAEAHGGRVWIEEVEPRGGRLLLQIPCGDDPKREAETLTGARTASRVAAEPANGVNSTRSVHWHHRERMPHICIDRRRAKPLAGLRNEALQGPWRHQRNCYPEEIACGEWLAHMPQKARF